MDLDELIKNKLVPGEKLTIKARKQALMLMFWTTYCMQDVELCRLHAADILLFPQRLVCAAGY